MGWGRQSLSMLPALITEELAETEEFRASAGKMGRACKPWAAGRAPGRKQSSPPRQLLGLAEHHIEGARDLDEDRWPSKETGMTEKGLAVRLKWEKVGRPSQRGRMGSAQVRHGGWGGALDQHHHCRPGAGAATGGVTSLGYQEPDV